MIQLSKPYIGDEEIRAVTKVLKSGQLSQGEITSDFEDKFAEYCKVTHAVAFSSATAAIHTALHALGVSAVDEAITTPFSFVASANPILMVGAKVIFVDIKEDDFCIDTSLINKALTKRTKAIIPVDLFGQIYDYEGVNKEIKDKGVSILEDASQAIGAEHRSVRAGNFGDIGVFSFYATKNLTTGEGGMAITNNSEYARKMRLFRHHGQLPDKRYEYFELGYNYRMTDVMSAIGREQLKRIDGFNKKRIKNSEILTEGLKKIKGIITPVIHPENKHIFHQYTIRVTREFPHSRQNLIDHLTKKGIGNGIYYPKPLHVYPHFKKLGYKRGDFPVAERVAQEVLSLPVHPLLSEKELHFIVEVISKYAN